MSDTQEKLEGILGRWHSILTHKGDSSGDEYYQSDVVSDIELLIESAKREALEEMRPANATIESMRMYSPRKHTYMGKEYPSCSICGFCPEAMNAYIDAQLKQSEESE